MAGAPDVDADFMDTIFPGIIEQLRLLNKARDVLLDAQQGNVPELYLTTVDGCDISWGYQTALNFMGKFKHPLPTKKWISYRAHDAFLDKGDRARMDDSFIRTVLESLEAAVARSIALKLGDLGMTFQVNHTIFRIRPCDVPAFHKVVGEVFAEPCFSNLLNVAFVALNRSRLKGPDKVAFDKICSQISSNFEFIWDGECFVAESIYVPRGVMGTVLLAVCIGGFWSRGAN